MNKQTCKDENENNYELIHTETNHSRGKKINRCLFLSNDEPVLFVRSTLSRSAILIVVDGCKGRVDIEITDGDSVDIFREFDSSKGEISAWKEGRKKKTFFLPLVVGFAGVVVKY